VGLPTRGPPSENTPLTPNEVNDSSRSVGCRLREAVRRSLFASAECACCEWWGDESCQQQMSTKGVVNSGQRWCGTLLSGWKLCSGLSHRLKCSQHSAFRGQSAFVSGGYLKTPTAAFQLYLIYDSYIFSPFFKEANKNKYTSC
jgi:hypothetical protein